MINNKKILLHVCCATCAAGCLERLKEMGFEDIVFFEFNPNIDPPEEHEKRCKDIRALSEMKNVPLIEGEHDHAMWLEAAEPYRGEKEGGKRCDVCFDIRLEKTAEKAKEIGAGVISTTLSVSPHKAYLKVLATGKEAAKKYGVEFLEEDFKKRDGFKKSLELSKKYNFYRQNYCGCEFSIR